MSEDSAGEVKLIAVPDDVIRKWYHHEQKGQDMRLFVDDITQKFGTLADLREDNNKNKRSHNSPVLATPPSKRHRSVDLSKMLVAADSAKGIEKYQACCCCCYSCLLLVLLLLLLPFFVACFAAIVRCYCC